MRRIRIHGATARGASTVPTGNIFVTVKRAPTATFLGKLMSISSTNCVAISNTDAHADRPNIFTTKSYISDICQRTVDTTNVKYHTTLSTRTCLSSLGWNSGHSGRCHSRDSVNSIHSTLLLRGRISSTFRVIFQFRRSFSSPILLQSLSKSLNTRALLRAGLGKNADPQVRLTNLQLLKLITFNNLRQRSFLNTACKRSLNSSTHNRLFRVHFHQRSRRHAHITHKRRSKYSLLLRNNQRIRRSRNINSLQAKFQRQLKRLNLHRTRVISRLLMNDHLFR